MGAENIYNVHALPPCTVDPMRIFERCMNKEKRKVGEKTNGCIYHLSWEKWNEESLPAVAWDMTLKK